MKKIKPAFLVAILILSFSFSITPFYAIQTKVSPTKSSSNNKSPKVKINSPSKGKEYSGVITISITARDKEDGDLIAAIFINGKFVVNSNSYELDTSAYYDGYLLIHARAIDSLGYIGKDEISIIIINGNSPPPAPPPSPDVNHYALIVGISDYMYISDLNFCDEDATDWYAYLSSIGYQYITVLGDGNPSNYPKYDGLATRDNIFNELSKIVSTADSNDVISIVFSGHGGLRSDGSSFICPSDSDPYLYDLDIFDYEFAPIISLSYAERIFIFFDSCSSGGFIDNLMLNNPIGTLYITTTCTTDGYGYDMSNLGNGLWTYWYLEMGLMNGYSAHEDMEGNFIYAYSNYPMKASYDKPQVYDEDPENLFYLI